MATVATVEGGKASGQTKIVAAKKQVIRMPINVEDDDEVQDDVIIKLCR